MRPFWFWNDDLQDGELIRQIADFQAHGVDGFVIHPRVGLPRHLGWMLPGLLDHIRTALSEARHLCEDAEVEERAWDGTAPFAIPPASSRVLQQGAG